MLPWQPSFFEYDLRKKNPAARESYLSKNFDYTSALKQQEGKNRSHQQLEHP
jgi:hypothetical protein